MGRVTASAPGKVVLCGEYAVLDGAPAIAMAVDRRASVTIEDGSRATVSSIGLPGSADTRLLDSVCDVLDIDRPNAAITLDTGAFNDVASGRKLGIGSSAALAVALAGALSPRATSTDRILETALLAHRRFQGGRGSGVDIAASAAGGLIEYRQGEMPSALTWAAGLGYALLWSGVAASTSSKLASLGQQAARASRQVLSEASGIVAGLWRQGDAGALIDGYRAYVAALVAFDVDHKLGIFDAGHDALANHSNYDDVVYKPCGAGGGDVGIVLGTDAERVARFAQFAESRGFRRLELALDPQGARVTPEYA